MEPIRETTITVKEMRVIEENTIFLGISGLLMMENAGRSIADLVLQFTRKTKRKAKVVVVAGLGNNGGDGLVAARHLASQGFPVTVIMADDPRLMKREEVIRNFDIIKQMRLSVKLLVYRKNMDAVKEAIENADIIIDALLGIGLQGRVREPHASLIQLINNSKGIKVSVDVPSGLDADSGNPLGPCVKADYTITFHKMKQGLVNNEYAGRIHVANIGIPPEAEIIVGPGDLKYCLQKRPRESKKGDYGRIIIIGGSAEYSGAPALTALAALRTGADIVTVLVPERIEVPVRSFSPNLIVKSYPSDHPNRSALKENINLIEKHDVIAVGPGLGLNEDTILAVKEMLRLFDKPMVIDADGLKAIKGSLDLIYGKKAVLTPHAGEFKILFNAEPPRNLEERMKKVKELAGKYSTTILLKGHIDVISNGIKVKANPTGNPAMTVGGTGDVLTGIVATFLAHTEDPLYSAAGAAFLNGLIGDYVSSFKGAHITATDIIDYIPVILSRVSKEVDIPTLSQKYIQKLGL